MRVAVLVSGGMDSLLALALLAEAGHEVLALTGVFFADGEAGKIRRQKLSALCARHGIPFHVADLRTPFEALVVQPFVESYLRGETPNPCALCNPRIKFGLLAEEAKQFGCQRVATGHYARVESGEDGPALRRGQDPAKDQSYFLALTPRAALANLLLPLGGWKKADVPAALAARGLTPPEASESQEVCFIPGDDYRAFLLTRGAPLPGPGPIALSDGSILGLHQGLWNHTLGQRRGIGVAYSEPLYVIDKRCDTNTLVVGTKAEDAARAVTAREVNLLTDPAAWPETVLVQTRYRQRPAPARARVREDRLHLAFTTVRSLPAPGQVAAVYDAQERLLAGGIIDAIERPAQESGQESGQ